VSIVTPEGSPKPEAGAEPGSRRAARLEAQSRLRILIVRPDRLGDVILSTPVFEAIKRHYPRAHLCALVRENVAPLLRGLSSVDEVMVYDPDRKHRGLKGLLLLAAQLRKREFRIGVVLQSNWRIALALVLGRVLYRVGPLSKPHSFVFYNRGVRQHRSLVEMHESDYNLQLVRRLGIRVPSRKLPTRVHLPEESLTQAKAWLEERGWDPARPLVAVHPGMGGSALNWPEAHYIELIRALIREGRAVLLTAGPSEAALATRVQGALGDLASSSALAAGAGRFMSYVNPGDDPVTFLGALYRHASLVIAPSTGPLHLAVAVGTPVVTFYPPIRVQSALRWGPYLPDETHASVLVPENYCGEDFSCRGSLCHYYPCMKSLTVAQALEEANVQLLRISPPHPQSQQP
jgi:ADP-heptose:LPS heptosyltransferase